VIHSRLLVDSIHGWIHTTVSFSYDKVFDHNALQENVFVGTLLVVLVISLSTRCFTIPA
jgi:hypothetical protein